MLNGKVIFRILGILTVLVGICMALSIPIALIYGDGDAIALLISSVIAITTGSITTLLVKSDNTNMGKREGFLIVTLSWIIFSI